MRVVPADEVMTLAVRLFSSTFAPRKRAKIANASPNRISLEYRAVTERRGKYTFQRDDDNLVNH